jgi:hypothetical protein
MAQMIGDALNQAGTNFVDALTRWLPRLVTMIAIVVAGWLIAYLLRGIVRLVLRWLHFNAGAERAGIGAPLRTAGLPPADALVASVVFWLVWIGFLLSGIDVLEFTSLQGLLSRFTAFIPSLIVALFILAVGLIAANFVWRAALLAAVNAKVPSPRLLAGGAWWLIVITVGAMALEQVVAAQVIVVTAFAITFGAVMLATAIAFGVAATGVAKRILDHLFRDQERQAPDEISHL